MIKSNIIIRSISNIANYINCINKNNYFKYTFNDTKSLSTVIIRPEFELFNEYIKIVKENNSSNIIIVDLEDKLDTKIIYEMEKYNFNYDVIFPKGEGFQVKGNFHNVIVIDNNSFIINYWPVKGSLDNYTILLTPIYDNLPKFPLIFGEEFIDIGSVNTITNDNDFSESLKILSYLPKQSILLGKYNIYLKRLKFIKNLFQNNHDIQSVIDKKISEINENNNKIPISHLCDELVYNPYFNTPNFIPNPKLSNLKKIEQQFFKEYLI